jgi:two-component system chemotaxis response regulator CheY
MSDRKKTVLVVDDEAAIRLLAVKLLESRGYATREASTGDEALDVLRSGAAIDLVVLDVRMPGRDGLATLEEIRAMGLKQLPVLLLTSQKEHKDILKGYKTGAHLYITKPLRPAHLVNSVEYLIGDLSPDERQRLELLL